MTDLQTFDLLLKMLAMRWHRGDDFSIQARDFLKPLTRPEVRGLEWVEATPELRDFLFRACIACAALEPEVMGMNHATWDPAWTERAEIGWHEMMFDKEPLLSRFRDHIASTMPPSSDAPSETDLSILKTWLNDALRKGRTGIDATELESYAPCGIAAALPRLAEWQNRGWLRLETAGDGSASLEMLGLIDGPGSW